MKVLPTKHVGPANAAIGVGGLFLLELGHPRTVSALWERVATDPSVRTFDRFVLTLDFLYAIGAIELHEGLLRRTPR